MARPVFRPIIFALKRAPTWPGLALAPAWGDPAPDGYEFVYDRNGILRYANDGSPYISNGSEMISYYEYESRDLPPAPDPLSIVVYEGMAVTYEDGPITTYVSYPEDGYVS